MKFLLLSLVLVLSPSCSTFKDAFKKAAAHEKMAKELDNTAYEMSTNDLQNKVVAFMESTDISKGKWVYVNNTGSANYERNLAIEETMNDGFTYKDKLYVTAWSPDMSLFSGDMEKFKKSVLQSTYHVIEKDEKNFTIVKGNVIFEGSTVAPGKSRLKVYKLTKVVRPTSIGLDWWNLLKGKGLLPTFTTLPVDLQSSRQYQEEDKVHKLTLFFHIDRERAEKMEADFIAAEPG